MIKRELYMSRIRPFIGTDLIKVMTGIRRCGKSVMLELIKQELTEDVYKRQDGYEAVSVSQIAGELDMTKGALYRHYKSKRDIFDCIVQRMERCV